MGRDIKEQSRRDWPWKSLALGLLIGFIVVGALWLIVGFCVPRCLFPDSQTTQPVAAHELRGTFGDQFGAINALFSGLALAGIVAALILQQREIWLALEEQKCLNMQHRRAIQTEIVLSLMGNINSEQWGDAHRTVAQWARGHPNDFIELFKENCVTEGSQEQAVDRARRILVDPYHKVIRLYQADIVTKQLARVVLTPDICWTLYFIIRHLEQGIRTHADLMGAFVLKLYPRKTLIEQGRYYEEDKGIEATSDQQKYKQPEADELLLGLKSMDE